MSINPLVPDAQYSERQDEPFSLLIQRLEVDLKFNFIFCTLGTNGLRYWCISRRNFIDFSENRSLKAKACLGF